MDSFVVEQIKGHVSTIHVIRSWVTVIYCYTVLLFIELFTLLTGWQQSGSVVNTFAY